MVMSATKIVVQEDERRHASDLASALSGARSGGGELVLRDADGRRVALPLTGGIVDAISTVLARLGDGDAVVLLSEEDELSPERAAKVLGMSRPLVYHRMDTGRLPSRTVGAHRRVKLKDVLALAREEERRREFSRELAADTDDQDMSSRA